jgi:hypothetical protein
MSIIKNQNLDLSAFLYSVICLSNKNINKHSVNNLDDTNDVKFSLGFWPNQDIPKLHVFSYMNGMILNITFKFITEINMWLIFRYFYAPRKKRRLIYSIETRMCRLFITLKFDLNRKFIDFIFLHINFIFVFVFVFSFFLYFFHTFLEFCSFLFVYTFF